MLEFNKRYLSFQKVLYDKQFQDWVYHGHKKRKDSLKTRTVLLIVLFELEISGMAV